MKELNLGTEKINKLLFSFAIPCVISMLVNSVYNIVDQIFIGKGVGTLGNAATNVIFPIVILCNAIAGLIGNGAAANFSLKLGEGKKEVAQKTVGEAITITFFLSIIFSIICFIFLPKLIYFFGCTASVEKYAISYGNIILIGAPFMIFYTVLSSIIRADGSPKYSMILLIVGAIINLILDPIFIFILDLDVAGGALATILGQIVSFIMAIIYIPKMKTVKITKNDLKLDHTATRILSLGLSSFITQGTVLILFIFMNNLMTKYGYLSKYGSEVPLSVYGVVSKLNNLFVSTVLGISIGAQPIIGFNYGAGNKKRVKDTLKKVLLINFIVGIAFNIVFVFFSKQSIGIFISSTDKDYELFMEFGQKLCQGYLMLCCLNFLEMTTSIVIQSLGSVKKATMISFTRQIILFIPLSLLFCIVFKEGIFAVMKAGPIADLICFIICLFIFSSEYKKLDEPLNPVEHGEEKNITYQGKKIVITIAREYGSGGRYIGKLVADKLGIKYYDKELIRLAALQSGLEESYINSKDQIKENKIIYQSYYNEEDQIFISESNIIKEISNDSCVIIGRCADYILQDKKDVLKVFIYNSDKNKIKRATKYYKLKGKNIKKQIQKINEQRKQHYKYYTNQVWNDLSHYDLCINTDYISPEVASNLIVNAIKKN